MKRFVFFISIVLLLVSASIVLAATIIPNEIQEPGTQAGEISNLESPDRCDNCHGGYDLAVEPSTTWMGSMMANATRDPVLWATLAVAEQDFDGSGEYCIRCHSTSGYYAGSAIPSDGSGLAESEATGIDCDACHKMTNTNQQEIAGVMTAPYIANDGGTPPTGYYGSGMVSLSDAAAKLGPYSDAEPKHQFAQSLFHRDVDYCGTCHDVSNPAVGDLAHNNGTQSTSDPVTSSGELGSAVDLKAAFNNFPYQYGIVERTYSEYKASALPTTLVSDYPSLPEDLQAGAIEAAYLSSGGDYEDGTARYYSCQTCHMSAVSGYGANKSGIPFRADLPLHDMTGGNYWVPDVIKYMDTAGTLLIGGGLSDLQISALDDGKLRVQNQLNLAASLDIAGDSVRVTNLTGHKLISGYPEGRRMWLNIKWYSEGGDLIREDGAYDLISVQMDDEVIEVATLLDLHDPNTRVYETHYGMTQEWAAQLLDLGYDPNLPLSYDRITGEPDYILSDLANEAPGTEHETFHFVLNNTVVKDNRIPPYGFTYEEARQRNTLPVPADQYGGTPGGTYNHWDEFLMSPPIGASYATIDLLYQPTTWEYVQFLYEANDGSITFLAEEGENLMDAWMNTGMAEPFVMASTAWGASPKPGHFDKTSPQDGAVSVSTSISLIWETSEGVENYEYCLDQTNDHVCSNWISSGLETFASPEGLIEGTTYYWQVRAINSGGTTFANGEESGFWSFTTASTPVPPGPFGKSEPLDGATDMAVNPTLAWGNSDGVSSYEYCVDQTNDNACEPWINTGQSPMAELTSLSYATTYFWQVRAVNPDGTTYADASDTAYWSFTTAAAPLPPGNFAKTGPENNAVDVITNPTLSWSASDGTVSYAYCIDMTDDNTCTTWNDLGLVLSVDLINLDVETDYFWQVKAINEAGVTFADGSEFAFFKFTTSAEKEEYLNFIPLVLD